MGQPIEGSNPSLSATRYSPADRIARVIRLGYHLSVATSGNGSIRLLSRDLMRRVHQFSGAEALVGVNTSHAGQVIPPRHNCPRECHM